MNENQTRNKDDSGIQSRDYVAQKQKMLWRAAEGRELIWVQVLGCSIGLLFLFSGVFGDSFGQRDAMISIVAGLGILIAASSWRQQSQIRALRELIKLDSKEAVSERLAS